MAWDFNTVSIMGRLVRDPEERVSQGSGTQICRFALANQQGNDDASVSFIDCVAFGREAQLVIQYCRRGKPIIVTGRIRQNRWQDQKGEKRSRIEINVSGLSFLPDSQSQNASSPMSQGREEYRTNPVGSPQAPKESSPPNKTSQSPYQNERAPQDFSTGHDDIPVTDEDIPF